MIDINEIFDNVQRKNPLIHHITNYVTVNDCANITLAAGASPIMTANIEELDDILSIANALVVNIGTMDKVEAFLKAPILANRHNVPVILDPVGAGASKKRIDTVTEMLKVAKYSAIKGNTSEILCIAGLSSNTRGVDASVKDSKIDTEKIAKIGIDLAEKLDTIIIITGKEDIIANNKSAYSISNGVSYMSKITGTGCMASSILGSYIGANIEKKLEAAITAIALMGIAGEKAYELAKERGTSSFRTALIDSVSKMTKEDIKENIKIKKII